MDPHARYVQILKEKLEQEIKLRFFISNEFLQELLSDDNIGNAGQSFHWQAGPKTKQYAYELDPAATTARPEDDYQGMAEVGNTLSEIRHRAPKLFAILILLDKPHLIHDLLKQGINDTILEGPKGASYYHVEQDLFKGPELQEIRGGIFDTQWRFPRRLPHYHISFPKDKFIPPFIEPTPNKPIGEGSYGAVFRAIIPGGHLERYREACAIAFSGVWISQTATFVYKKVQKSDWSIVKREVDALRARPHRNVIPLIASFDSSTVESSVYTEWVYMIFPEATGGDLKHWIHMLSKPSGLDTEQDQLKDYLYGVILQVASGLAYIHHEIDEYSTAHHDLKPGNIVQESDTWKVCDLGKSHLKPAGDDSGTVNSIGTAEYRPPEYYHNSGVVAEGAHGRSFDIFSLGCIALQLAVLAVYGWNGEIAKFRQDRETFSEKQRFPPMENAHLTSSFQNNLKLVNERIGDMRKIDGSERLGKVLSLIQEMLETDRKRRPFAWEIEANLFEMLNPNATKAYLERYFRGIIEPFKPRYRTKKDYHNPLSRADRQKKHIFAECIRDSGWPESSGQFTQRFNQRFNQMLGQQNISGEPCSNLPTSLSDCKLVGRHGVMSRLDSGFSHSNRVGLFGYGGNGKSHVAFEYAKQQGKSQGFKSALSRADQRHTFWVNAGNYSSFQKSYSEIAETIKLLNEDTASSFLTAVKAWLDDATNGDWILVLDGLDSKQSYERYRQYLPSARNGEIVITTQNRELLVNFNNLRDAECINLSIMTYEDRRDLLSSLTDLTDDDEKFIKPLLNELSFPLLIKVASKWLNRHGLVAGAVQGLYERLRSNKLNALEQLGFPNNVLGATRKEGIELSILEVLLSHGRDPSEFPKEAIDLLSTLACLCKDSLEHSLILRKYPKNYDHVYENLGILTNYSYIERNGGKTYIMHDMIQLCQIQWLLQSQGPKKVLKRFDEALCIIMNDYVDKVSKKTRKEKATTPSFLWKLEYMPHFEEFLKYVRSTKAKDEVNFRFTSNAAGSIVNFCRVYREDKRHDDAIVLLEYSLACNIRAGRDKAEKRISTWCELARTYKDRLSGGSTALYLNKALEIVEEGLTEAEVVGYKEQKWRLMLERSMILSRLGDRPAAREQLKVIEGIGLTGDDECKAIKRTTQEKACIDFEEGMELRRKSLVKSAREGWKAVVKCIHERYPKDELMMMEAKAQLAKVDLEIPTPNALDEAKAIYSAKVEWLKDTHNYAPNKRQVHIAERDLAAVWMRSGLADDISKARETLQQHLDHYVENYGYSDGEARRFAYLLRDAMSLQNDKAAIDRLNEEFGLNDRRGGLGIWYQARNGDIIDPDPDTTWDQ